LMNPDDAVDDSLGETRINLHIPLIPSSPFGA
jgi:hypothetical protein